MAVSSLTQTVISLSLPVQPQLGTALFPPVSLPSYCPLLCFPWSKTSCSSYDSLPPFSVTSIFPSRVLCAPIQGARSAWSTGRGAPESGALAGPASPLQLDLGPLTPTDLLLMPSPHWPCPLGCARGSSAATLSPAPCRPPGRKAGEAGSHLDSQSQPYPPSMPRSHTQQSWKNAPMIAAHHA